MTTVCLLGDRDSLLRHELLSRDGSREALSAYDIERPWENTIAVKTVSLGAAVSLLNDLDWYLVRFTRDAIIHDTSISEAEWLSRELGTAIREQAVEPENTGSLLKVYGVTNDKLVEPMYLQRVDSSPLTYDLRRVDDTLPVRITENEFG